ncbi:hypothetical protein HYPSUDRAFT_60990 [Hypholoma sublateritium FD-334 SS-4]|uniref:Uncharacterized protein n=1 Tax=Hypholoma sublateritium (strain FD-334 SS-4) TaxID=945553 RepID=A0A0D2QEZ6_HYPSF|nr:hypothetical protein HYPSUDRAFT_60990 [Hypholoma sublateritium FD-334 SS-4]
MALSSVRELELETLLREKDAQLAEVTDEITVLRQYLSKQPGPSTSEPVTLPSALLSVLLPHINAAAGATTGGSTSTVTAALTQRTRVLQEENDELYQLLKHSETGKLKDEVRGLRRVVAKLEGALKESHKAIVSLSSELDKAYETIQSASRPLAHTYKSESHSHSHSPHNSYHAALPSESGGGGSGHKPPPTEPRAHKRPRLSEPQASPPVSAGPRLASSLPQKPQGHHHSGGSANGPRGEHARDRGRHAKAVMKMEVDGADGRRATPQSRERELERSREQRERPRERERNNRDRERGQGGKERDRPRDAKDWDRDGGKNAHSRRNGHAGTPGRGSGGDAFQLVDLLT